MGSVQSSFALFGQEVIKEILRMQSSRSLFTFFLDKKSNKKIKAANKKAEISHISLKSRNSPDWVLYFVVRAGSNSLDFFTADPANF